jgi:hypothetical protein
MSLLGEKCVRCGKQRTRKEFAGVPTCEECQRALELKLAASKEAPHPCPIDQTAMRKEVVSNIVVDRCPTCSGVWLDGGELELLRGAIADGVTERILRGVLFQPV